MIKEIKSDKEKLRCVSVLMPESKVETATQKAGSMGLSLASFVRTLIYKELNKAE